jgi:hypothetical protein
MLIRADCCGAAALRNILGGRHHASFSKGSFAGHSNIGGGGDIERN